MDALHTDLLTAFDVDVKVVAQRAEGVHGFLISGLWKNTGLGNLQGPVVSGAGELGATGEFPDSAEVRAGVRARAR